MNAVTVAAVTRIEVDCLFGYEETTFPASPRLSAAVGELSGYIEHQPDITLGELRAALLGTGFEWAADGRLVFSPSRMALIQEFDDLIESHGWSARAADLFL